MSAVVVTGATACYDGCCVTTYDPAIEPPPGYTQFIRPMFQVLHLMQLSGSMTVGAVDYDQPDGILL